MSKNYNIAVIPGDGTGPEVVRESIKVLKAAASKFDFKMNFEEFDFCGERYLRTGEILPDSAPDQLRKFDPFYLELSDILTLNPVFLKKCPPQTAFRTGSVY